MYAHVIFYLHWLMQYEKSQPLPPVQSRNFNWVARASQCTLRENTRVTYPFKFHYGPITFQRFNNFGFKPVNLQKKTQGH